MILVDTSVWVAFFRKRNPIDLGAYADLGEVATCLPVLQEVLQGFRDEGAYRLARDSLTSLTLIENPLSFEVYDEAAQLYRRARREGLTVRSSVECLIAACALRHDIEILHTDRDYSTLARVCALRQRRAA